MGITNLTFEEFDPRYQDYFWTEDRANELLKEYGLDELGWTFKWDRAQHRLGVCRHKPKVIAFSQNFDHIGRAEIEDTIRHEIAHALVGPKHGHDATWRAMCVKVGAKPQRLADEHIQTQAKPNYRVYCTNCGYSFTRFRLREALLKHYHCARCGGKFDAEPL